MTAPIQVKAPSSKSVSHRALICSALAKGKSEVHDALQSVDLNITRRVLENAGAVIEEDGDIMHITGLEDGPVGANLKKDKTAEPVEAFMAESGTSCRLLTGVLAAGNGAFRVSGATRMHERPIGDLTDALTKVGTKFDFEFNPGFPPFIMHSKGLPGGSMNISLEESSQYLSGLLLAAPLAKAPTTIAVVGKKAVSWPYIALTLSAMDDFKIDFDVSVEKDGKWGIVPWRSLKGVEPGKVKFIVRPSEYEPSRYRCEADWSGGSYLLAAGAVGKRPVHVDGLRSDSLQGDRAILRILQNMGAKIETDHQGITVHPSKLHGVTVNMTDCPDLVPTVSVLAAFADSPTTITNVAHLRIKECDRLAAMVNQVAKAGCKTEDLGDGLRITPAPLPAGKKIAFETYGDHRIAMSTSIFGLAGIEVEHDNPGCVTKSFPTFFEKWATIMDGNK